MFLGRDPAAFQRSGRRWKEPFFTFHGLRVETRLLPSWGIHSEVDAHEYWAAFRQMRPGDRVLVAGNGMGSVSVGLAALFGRDSVLAYEANPYLVAMARDSICFSSGCLEVEHGALGPRDGSARLRIAHRWAESSIYPEWAPHQSYTDQVIEVLMVDTNRIIRDHGVTALCLDVEGSEHDIIPALDFSPLHWIVMEIHGPEERAARLADIVSTNGMTVRAVEHLADLQRIVTATRR
jgi:FkbM family methyltransferase